MDGQPTTAESQHRYQSHVWSGSPVVSTTTTPRVNPASPSDSGSPSLFGPQLDILPILFPQQIYHDKLLQYNKLLSTGRGGGGGLHNTPPVALSSPQSKTNTRSRSSSKVSNKDNNNAKQAAQSCHGNRAHKSSDIAERAPVKPAKELSSKMSAKKNQEQPNPGHNASARLPPSSNQNAGSFSASQSSSVPSTPHQHPRKFSFESREHSPGAPQNHSPRSAYSETNGNVPSLRPLPPRLGGCRFETAIPHSHKLKSKLSEEEEKKLEADMRDLYSRLLPTEKIEQNRKRLVEKLEKLFNNEWPGHDIKVHLFGSSGNLLCSDDSDVDICITTPWKELESVCLIADLLHRHGMEKVVCVSSAKVPIVKIWDPELNLACDMNVNNTLALENTRMVRTYVSIDERVRPLAMIVKHWTRRRIINDAAFGGTLSSYTWICLVIAFLQLRDPPVLPALHQKHNLKLTKPDGTRSEFADDLSKLRGFGAKNKESLAMLLFEFFRFYAHEFDYDKYALSIRMGKLLTKAEKKWHIGSNNALCVEEPFNTIRNLGNTADDTSFRGLHMELRRAFDLVAEAKLDECCKEYVFPKEEERIWQKPNTAPRPILVRSASQQQHQQSGRLRGGYPRNRQYHRNGGNGSRRTSSSVGYEASPTFANPGMPQTLGPHDLLWYQTQNPQLVPNDILATSLSALAQESMRFQLYTQLNQQQVMAHAQRLQNGSATDRSRTNSFDSPPLTAPVRPDLMYGFGFPMQGAQYFQPGFAAYPSSPSTTAPSANGQPEFRRSLHRNASTSDSGSTRSQSQPASRTPMTTTPSLAAYSTSSQSYTGILPPSRQMNGGHVPSFVSDEAGDVGFDDGIPRVISESPPQDDGPRYVGYYVNDHSNLNRPSNGVLNNGVAPAESKPAGQGGGGRRRLSTDQLPSAILDRRMKRTSRSPSPAGQPGQPGQAGHNRAVSIGVNSAPLLSASFVQANGNVPAKPLVVNGTAPAMVSTPVSSRPPVAPEHTASDFEENALHISQGFPTNGSWPEQQQATPSTSSGESVSTPVSQRPVIVNGSSANRSPAVMSSLMMGAALHHPYSTVVGDPAGMHGFSRLHTRQLAPLDLATSEYVAHQDFPHLSPVYENRTPSPTASRRFEPSPIVHSPGVSPAKEFPKGPSKSGSGSSNGGNNSRTPNSSSSRQQQQDSTTRSPAHEQRINGLVRENGHVRAAKSQTDSFSGWQKSKSRKKGASDLKHAANGFPQSEVPPKNEADRKGG
ncbi:hypothetical protein VTJ49DRAFT_7441 [Mycothermus thermophilus]|uniref:polynucleotide adenylyltransferase n=1 Tax=Humicola insolens TaxID=85995 RepID=A0ABR3VH73_HUMIN